MKAKNKKITGAHLLMKSLERQGVKVIFGYPGGAIMPVYDALQDYLTSIRHVLVRHEQGAAHAAQGYAHQSGKAGVCLVTSGPGATNLITGITDAMSDSVPLVCLTGQVATYSLGTDAFQEAPIVEMTKPVTKWSYQLKTAEEIPEIIAKAFLIAEHGRPGPVLIDLPKDIQQQLCDEKELDLTATPAILLPLQKNIQRAADLLNNAKRPLVLFGHGVLIARAEQELRALIERGGYPAASTLLGLSAVPTEHPLYVGMLGMHGNYAPNKLTNQADIILAVGMRFDDRVTGKIASYAREAKIIHIDIDIDEFNKVVPAEVAIHADAKAALKKLLPLLKPSTHAYWLKRFAKYAEEEHKKVSHAELYPKKGPLTMAEVIRSIHALSNNPILVADVGQHQMIAARYSTFLDPNSFITSGGLGTMGFALPASIGAKIASPKREVIAIIGDGSFQMNMQELGTLMQENLAIKILILNNERLGMVRQWQEMFYSERYSFVDMKNPDFNYIAQAYGIPSETVCKRSTLSSALERFLSAKGSYLLDVRVQKDEKVFPMIPSGASIDAIRLE